MAESSHLKWVYFLTKNVRISLNSLLSNIFLRKIGIVKVRFCYGTFVAALIK